MPSINHLYNHFKTYGGKHRSLYNFSFLILFWAIFDGIISFVTPIFLVDRGFSLTEMGIILGSSAVAGALFDFILCKVLKKANYRRIFLVAFIVAATYPFIFWHAQIFWLYMVAMAIWGLYYDLINMAKFDFVGRYTEETEHASSFGVIQVFLTFGYMIAPLIAGLAIGEKLNWTPFAVALIFLTMAFIFFVMLWLLRKKDAEPSIASTKPLNVLVEASLWQKIGKIILPVLILTLFLNILDSFFWTIGPIFGESFKNFQAFAGLFLTIYSFPILIMGWFVGKITARFGKKRTAFYSFFIGSLILALIPLTTGPVMALVIIGLSSFFTALSWPAINGVYADYIGEAPIYSKEIMSIEDFFANSGFIVGHIISGFLADQLGYGNSFLAMGLIGALLAIILMIFSPRKIKMPNVSPKVLLAQ